MKTPILCILAATSMAALAADTQPTGPVTARADARSFGVVKGVRVGPQASVGAGSRGIGAVKGVGLALVAIIPEPASALVGAMVLGLCAAGFAGRNRRLETTK